jgi:hypothetical protein
MESDGHSELSQGEVSVSSACTGAEIHMLQNEILEQTKQIQLFIETTDSDESPAFVVLKSLFTLFKSELSVNLSLRKLLFDQRKSTESISVEIGEFLAQVRGLGYDGIDSFNAILSIIHDQTKRARRLRKLGHASADQIRRNGELEAQLEAMRLQEAESSVAIASLNAQLAKSASEAAALRNQIGAQEKQLHSLHSLLTASEKGKHETAETEMALVKEAEALRRRAEEAEQQKVRHREKFHRAREKVRELSDRIQEIEEVRGQEIESFQARFETERAARKRKVEDLQIGSGQAIAQLKEAHRQEIEELRRAQAREMEKISQAWETEKGQIRKQHAAELREQAQKFEVLSEEQRAHVRKLEAIISQLQLKGGDDDQAIKRKYHKVVKKIQALKAELEQIAPIHESEIRKLQQEYEDRERQLRAQLEGSCTGEINRCKSAERELRFDLGEQQLENKRLREQLRQYSFILEQKESVLAQLQLEADRRCRRSKRNRD